MATLKGHGQPLIIIMSAAENGHSSVRRKKAPVQSSHRSSVKYGDESPGRKTPIDRPQRYECFCESGAMLESYSLQIEKDTASPQLSTGWH